MYTPRYANYRDTLQLRARLLEDDDRVVLNERLLFHGSPFVDKIAKNGFKKEYRPACLPPSSG